MHARVGLAGGSLVTAIWLATGLAAQTGTAIEAQEFPGFDASALSLQRTGLDAKRARQALADAPDAPETARLLVNGERLDDALGVLRRIVEQYPDRIAAAFGGIEPSMFQRDATKPHAKDLLTLAAQARERITALPREEQARTAYSLVRIESQLDRSQTWASRLKVFVAAFDGTEAALLAQVDVISAAPINASRLDALDAFAREHPGTAAAAKAHFQKGFDLAHNASALRIERPGDDPTPRFTRTMDLVRELTSGRYPKCEWVDKAPELLTGFFMYQPKFSSPANIEAMLTAYRDFVRGELPKDPPNLPGSTLDYVITSKMGQLHALAGRDRVAGVEQELAALERASPQPGAVQLLRAQFYLRNIVEIPAERAALIAKARATLEGLVAARTEPYARRALATLAAVQFYERDYAAAIPIYRRYLASYPSSDWAWVAQLRLGQSQMATGDAAAAAQSFAALATRAGAAGFMQVLGHAFAAEARASTGEVGEAARHAELALARWDDDHGIVYRSRGNQAQRPGDGPLDIPRDTDLEKAALPARIAELREAASLPGGGALERGRALIRQGRFADARALLERAATDARGTALEPAARSLAHRAWLEQALSLADIEGAARDDAAAVAELETLGAQPVDFPVVAARIARATMGAVGSGATDADALVSSALQAWRTQQPLSPTPAMGSLEADVLAIRAAVYLPLGGGIYAKGRWEAGDFPATLPSFLVVNPTLRVNLSDGSARRVTLRRPIAGFDNVLFIDDEQLALMTTMIRRLGGTGRRAPAQIMETPNQPVGRARDVGAYWNRFFRVRPGHWSGWVFETYPIIRDVTFQNAERTRAAVRVEVGYSGGTVILEKQQGTWRAVDLVNMWIT